jgi:hypothetical protein
LEDPSVMEEPTAPTAPNPLTNIPQK